MRDNELKKLIAVIIHASHDLMTSKEIAASVDTDYQTVYSELKAMCKKGTVEKIGTRYTVTEEGIKELCRERHVNTYSVAIDAGLVVREKVVVEESSVTPVVSILETTADVKPINKETRKQINETKNTTVPAHYQGKTIDVLGILDEFLTPEAVAGFNVGNVIKYVLRFKGKGGVDDLRKARDYLDRMIESYA